MEMNKKNTANAGTTMVEVLVAFAILMVIFAVVYQVICLSGEIHMKTVDLIRSDQELEAEIYRKNASGAVDRVWGSFTLHLQDETGSDTDMQPIALGTVWVDCYENPVRKENVFRLAEEEQ